MPEFSARNIVRWMNRTKKEASCLSTLLASLLSRLAARIPTVRQTPRPAALELRKALRVHIEFHDPEVL